MSFLYLARLSHIIFQVVGTIVQILSDLCLQTAAKEFLVASGVDNGLKRVRSVCDLVH